MKAKLAMSLLFCLVVKVVVAQSTYNFENATVGATTFTDQGVSFSVTTQSTGSDPFKIRKLDGYGWNGTAADDKFIDNLNANDNKPIKFTITANQNINLKSMYLYLSNHSGDNNSGPGTCRITGKVGSTEVFTVTASSGFNANLDVNNGFTLINLSTYGGADNSTKVINNFIVETTGNFEYVALDALKWSAPTVLPVTLVDYAVKAEGNYAKLQWQTSSETNNKGFEIYRSGDDKQFIKIGKVNGKGIASVYAFTDKQPRNGNNYYRLVQVDNDGKPTELGERILNFSLSGLSVQAYPNPTKNNVTVTFGEGNFKKLVLSDNLGRILQQQQIETKTGHITIDLSAYRSGVYFISLKADKDEVVRKVVKQ